MIDLPIFFSFVQTNPTATTTAQLSPEIPAAEATEKLLRAKRQFFLEKELSSAADESENLAIEEVCPLFGLILVT